MPTITTRPKAEPIGGAEWLLAQARRHRGAEHPCFVLPLFYNPLMGPAIRSPIASCRRASDLVQLRDGAWLDIAGLVTTRQRPGTAKGVVFVTLEDETGSINVIVWKTVFERYRRAIISSRLMHVHGRLQRQSSVTHVIAERVTDISDLLDLLDGPGRRSPR